MRLKTWLVAALGLGSLVVLIVVSMLASSRKAQDIYAQLDQLNAHHRRVEANLRRLRSDVNLSGIFVRDYLLDVARERAPEYREQLAEFRRTNMATLAELRDADAARRPHREPAGQAGRLLADVRSAVRLDADARRSSAAPASCAARSCRGARRC